MKRHYIDLKTCNLHHAQVNIHSDISRVGELCKLYIHEDGRILAEVHSTRYDSNLWHLTTDAKNLSIIGLNRAEFIHQITTAYRDLLAAVYHDLSAMLALGTVNPALITDEEAEQYLEDHGRHIPYIVADTFVKLNTRDQPRTQENSEFILKNAEQLAKEVSAEVDGYIKRIEEALGLQVIEVNSIGDARVLSRRHPRGDQAFNKFLSDLFKTIK